MNRSDIKKIYYNGVEITSLYVGGNLIYPIVSGNVWKPYNISGTIDPQMTPTKLSLYLNGSTTTTNIPVDTTKTPRTFDYEYTTPLTSCEKMFWKVDTVGTIDNLPDTSNVTSMRQMFSGLSENKGAITTSGFSMNLKQINFKNFDTSNVVTMSGMFGNCQKLSELDLSGFDTSKVTDMSYMFYGNIELSNLKQNFDTSEVTDMSYMFNNCQTITDLNISNFNFTNATTIKAMFQLMRNLEKLTLNADFSVLTNTYNTFHTTEKLSQIRGSISNLSTGLDLHYCPLDNESVMLIFNGLSQVSTSEKITLKTTTYNTLTTEQIALATSKGWSVIKS